MISLGYAGLFIACFLSATLVPFPSELTVYWFLTHSSQLEAVFLLATLGNGLGGWVTYWMGTQTRRFNRFKHKKRWGEQYVQRYGSILGLLSWIPIIGDPLLFTLGYYETPTFKTLLFMFIGKGLRYAVLIYFV